MNTKCKLILIAFLGVLCIILLLQNTQVVSLQFFFWEISMSRIILIPIILGIGFLFGFIVGRRS